MLLRSTVLHLRIPFSLFLMPVFCFAASQPPFGPWPVVGAVFLILHLLLYPASNGYNSWFDKDEDSIGGLEKPPKVERQLYFVSLALDAFALLAGTLIMWEFALMLLVYGLVSKAYSHPSVRLKKYPVISLFAAAIFQGGFTYLMTYQVLHHLSFSELLTNSKIWLPAALCTLMIIGFYPLTQVYQHEEDARRGDLTFSRMLGIRGTFIFSCSVFFLANGGYLVYFIMEYSLWDFLIFQACMFPAFIHLLRWTIRVGQDQSAASFRPAMRMNLLGSLGMLVFFLVFAWSRMG